MSKFPAGYEDSKAARQIGEPVLDQCDAGHPFWRGSRMSERGCPICLRLGQGVLIRERNEALLANSADAERRRARRMEIWADSHDFHGRGRIVGDDELQLIVKGSTSNCRAALIATVYNLLNAEQVDIALEDETLIAFWQEIGVIGEFKSPEGTASYLKVNSSMYGSVTLSEDSSTK